MKTLVFGLFAALLTAGLAPALVEKEEHVVQSARR